MTTARLAWIGPIAIGLLSACGGGGSSSSTLFPGGGGGNADPYTPGIFQPSASFANRCVVPRSGTNPATGDAYPDQSGSRTDENNFLRSWTNELYLWYDEVPDLNPANYQTLAYFDLLKTDEQTASEQPKDKFHFTYDSLAWYRLSQSGVSAGYGAQWLIMAATPPRRIVVAYTEPGSPAANAGLQRGDEVLEIDGQDAVHGNTQAVVDALNGGLFPDDGDTYDFRLRNTAGMEFAATMTADEVTSQPVQNVRTIELDSGELVGYLLFNDHIATAESQLIDAIETLDAANITDLVLDIRYNGGGYLAIASQLAYMIAGDTPTAGRVFERMMFNDKHPTTNPVTGQPLTPLPFVTTTQNLSAPPGIPLPTLDLTRVYVLTGPNTCSASEAIMNSLRGVDVDVYQIGSTTCGKPYGFYPRDNCGITYFSIQFKGVNARDFGDYFDGFSPDDGTTGVIGEPVPGCRVADDLDHALGDEHEARLAAALAFRASNNQSCPASSSFAPDGQLKPNQSAAPSDGHMYKSPFHRNRIMRR